MYIISLNDNRTQKSIYIWRPEKTECLKKKMYEAFSSKPNSAYDALALRILNVIFDYGENITKKYETLYSVEYEEFKSYLKNEEGLLDEEISMINEKKQETDSLWKVNVSISEGYNFANMCDGYIWEGDFLVPRLNEFFERCN